MALSNSRANRKHWQREVIWSTWLVWTPLPSVISVLKRGGSPRAAHVKLADSQLIVTWCNLVNEQLNICTPSPTVDQSLTLHKAFNFHQWILLLNSWMMGWCCWPPHRPRAGVSAAGDGCFGISWWPSKRVPGKIQKWWWNVEPKALFPWQGTCSKGTGTSRDHRELGRGLLGKPSWSWLVTGSAQSARLLLWCFGTCAGLI